MAETAASQQLFDLWKRQVEEGADTWARLLAQAPSAPAADATALWRPAMAQVVQAWASLLAMTPLPPDLLAQWKQLTDQTIETWSRAFSQVMNTDAFAQMLGRTLDQVLSAATPVKRVAEPAVDNALKVVGLPSRAQVTSVAAQIVDLDDRIDRIEDGLATIARRLEDMGRALARERGASA